MEISEIKSRLSMAAVLAHYGLKPDKHNRICCPFHNDKTPSMQVYYKTQTAYCFSSNCKTHGKSLDVIDFIMYRDNLDKHNAILKAAGMLSEAKSRKAGPNGQTVPAVPLLQTSTSSVLCAQGAASEKALFLERMFIYFKNAVHNSPPAKQYIEKRKLDYEKLDIGYNSGQFHHGQRKDENLIKQCLQVGLLKDEGQTSRTGDKAYKPFGKWCIVFPLKNKNNQVTGLYFRSTLNDTDKRHYYLENRQGLYPCYPEPVTEKLILTEAIIDAASLLLNPEITNKYSVLACYGTNGLTDEHRAAIAGLKQLNEIIFFFDGDKAGKEAVKKYAAMFKELLPHVKITNVETPEKEDINSLLQGHSLSRDNGKTGIFVHFLETRTTLLLSNEDIQMKEKEPPVIGNDDAVEPGEPEPEPVLNTENPHNIKYTGGSADYYVKGGLRGNLDSIKVSLQIVHRETWSDHRAKADLYEYKQVESLIKTASEQLNIPPEEIKKDLSRLTHQLEQYRNKTLTMQKNSHHREPVKIPEASINQCLGILQSANPIERINELIGKSGVVGEENNRIFLFAIAGSYKMPDTLHALIQGSSGSGKTMLLKTIYDLMPPEDTTKFTRVTDSSFYNYSEHYFVHRLVCFEDIDGLKEDALYAVRELISNELLVSSTSVKTEDGQITGVEKTVRGPIASISCTTKGEIYEDNMSRVFLIAVDESPLQTRRIIQYQQKKASGEIDRGEEKKAKELLQNCIRLLMPYEVVNPYAGKIQLPEEAHKIRRLNDLYLSFVRQVTLINQYKRKKDNRGRLITEPEDLQTANEIMFDSIVLKVDELDGSLRGFYERLKSYINQKGKDYIFGQREIRQELRVSKTGCQNYINALLELEYIHKTYVGQRNVFNYKINYWDSLEALRERIKTYLDGQLKNITGQ